MSRIARLSLLVTAGFIAASCSPPPEPVPDPLNVTADKSQVTADGAETVSISVSGATTPVRLSATKGAFQDSGRGVTNLPGDGTAVLVTCDSRLDPLCSGAVKVNASSENGAFGSVTLTFNALESCVAPGDEDADGDADCADADCDQTVCTLENGGTGTCSGGACVCTTGSAEVCDDGVDNNCDGLVDCEDDAACENQRCTLGNGNGGVCTSMNTCACPDDPEACGDGIDNDCDGDVDCADADCQPVGNQPGQVCDGFGNTCSPVINGVSLCSVCLGNGPDAQDPEVSCGDAVDNDCDGKTDCQDGDCAGVLCESTGKLCDGQSLLCSCPGGSPETTCNDFVDNDCDGDADCADTDCYSNAQTQHACRLPNVPAAGHVCDATGKCVCSGNGGPAETKEGGTSSATTCGDGADNDCDGLADCLDPDCRASGSGLGKNCSQPTGNPPTVGMACSAAGTCICSGNGGTPEVAETLCNDADDNDCDGLVDCADPDCATRPCGANGQTCVAINTCGCLGGSTETCNDNVDNDCDGLIDCQDGNCAVGTQCHPSSSNYQCTSTQECKDVTSTFSLTLTAAPTRLAANGVATSTVTATLKNGPAAVPGATVTFAVTTGAGTVTSSAVTNAQGVATVTYQAGTAGGLNTVTGSYDTGTQIITGAAVVDTPALGQIQLTSQQYQVMGVRFSSYNETNEITFKLFDSAGQPYPAGLPVSFSHAPVGGSFIGATPSCTATTCTASGVTDAQGLVKVTLHSGTVASVVAVSVSATGGGVTSNASASNIAIVGAKPSGGRTSITCTPYNVPGFVTNDCLNSQVNANIECTAAFADRFNNILGVQTVTTFKSEAAASNATAQTDPNTGLAEVSVSVLGFSLPADVAPQTGEYSLSYDSGCGMKIHNPRDGLVSIIVVANGEEGFIDGSNAHPANGTYDVGEDFIDLAEPFVDSDDSGTRDNGEDYVDSNNNGQWDGPNGAWDADTRVWAETRVVYTGLARIAADGTGAYEISRWFEGAQPPTGGASLPPTYSVAANPSTTHNLGVYFADKNFNRLTSQTTFTIQTISGGVQSKYTLSPASVDTLGMNFSQQFCSTPTGGTCSTTCQDAPCYVVTDVSGFSYGNYGSVEIKGAGQGGPGEVRVNAVYKGITVPLSVYGVCAPPP